jgi:hypothetical protein
VLFGALVRAAHCIYWPPQHRHVLAYSSTDIYWRTPVPTHPCTDGGRRPPIPSPTHTRQDLVELLEPDTMELLDLRPFEAARVRRVVNQVRTPSVACAVRTLPCGTATFCRYRCLDLALFDAVGLVDTSTDRLQRGGRNS